MADSYFVPPQLAGLLTEDQIADARSQGLIGTGAALTQLSPVPLSFWQRLAQGLQAGRNAGRGVAVESARANIEQAQAYQKMQQEAMQRAMVEEVAGRVAQTNPTLGAAILANPDLIKELGKPMQGSEYGITLPLTGGQLAPATPKAPAGMRFRDDGSLEVVPGYPEAQGRISAASRAPSEFEVKLRAAGYTPGTPEYEQAARGMLQSGDQSNSAANTLRSSFGRELSVQNWRTIAPVLGSMQEAATRDTAAADLNIVYGLAKILDPGSVVREGELQMAQSTGDAGQRLSALYASVFGGQRLAPEVRAGLIAEAQSRANPAKQAYDATVTQYRGIAERGGVNPLDVIIDYNTPSGAPAAPNPSPPSPPGAPAGAPAAPGAPHVLNGRPIHFDTQRGRWVYSDSGDEVRQ